MPASDIIIKGAREHNLRDLDLVLPRNKLICLTGVSGSGKSSLAFDTIFAEGQRRYVESLSSFARQFLGQMPKPDVDLIEGLSPSISISQKSTGSNPRSTVGTITEIYDYLRVLFARVGIGHCPRCGQPITAQTVDQIIAQIMQLQTNTEFVVLAPIIRRQKGEYRDLFEDLLKQGFIRARVDGEIMDLGSEIKLDRQMRHDIEVVIDRLKAKPSMRGRLAESVELAIKIGKGNLIISSRQESVAKGPKKKTVASDDFADQIYSVDYACTPCGTSFQPPSPQLFSFNSPQGMCLQCDGLGDLYSFDPQLLVPDDGLSFKKGCFELLGNWSDLGRWRRHIYQGVADTMERNLDVEAGVMLETPWKELPERLKRIWLYGTGDAHITFTWRGGRSPMKYGGQFEGIISDFNSRYRSAKSAPKRRQLEKYMNTIRCGTCEGMRLNEQARNVLIESAAEQYSTSAKKSLPEICDLSVTDAHEFFSDLVLDPTRQLIAEEALKEIRNRLGFLLNVGLDYLTLSRTSPTLSGGESQRIRLAGQIGSGLVGVLYILDEPSIGLHARDNQRLISTLQRLRDQGNTVLVVEHDEDTMRSADHVIDFGPGPGVRGGHIVAEGPPNSIEVVAESVTGQYLSGKRSIEVREDKRKIESSRELTIVGARHNNLKDVDVQIPLGTFTCITGVSGSGKSSLVNDILVEALRRDLNAGLGEPGDHDRIDGLEHLDKMIAIDQSPIGRTPRSNPGTYTKMFDDIRKLYTQLPESKRRGYQPGRFSFNVKGGRCEACEGNGSNRLEMDFLADVWVTCPVCQGQRFNRETLQVKFKEHSIAEVLDMDVQDALKLFENIPKVYDKLKTLHDVGLDYLKIGQPSPTLSGGEAQRIKLARELVKKSTGSTLYLLDEPTTGLHFSDIQMLLSVLHGFVDAGNTVLVVEHNMDVIKSADWIVDLGPEGGAGGGRVVCQGTPSEIAANKESFTGKALKECLSGTSSALQTNGSKNGSKKNGLAKRKLVQEKLSVRGAAQHNLREVDVEIDREKMTVFCGPSGSGKSSLAMDTIYAEGQRRYVESLSSYARQFVNQMQKPRIEHIEGLSPAIAIEQKNLGSTPRSTVGTVTEVYDYLRILYSRLGQPHCPDCDRPIGTQTVDQVVDKLMDHADGTKLLLLAPIKPDGWQSFESLLNEVRSSGFIRLRIDGTTYNVDDAPKIDRRQRHEIEIVVDRLVIRESARSRVADSTEAALAVGLGEIRVAYPDEKLDENRWQVVQHSQHLACDECGRSFDQLTPHNFSFNSWLGWCSECEGLGTQTGANPESLLNDAQLSLEEGAINLWPNPKGTIASAMLRALSDQAGLPTDVPFEQLDARARRLIFYGASDRWFTGEIANETSGKSSAKNKAQRPIQFEFQYHGLYPALTKASRQSAALRGKLLNLVDTVECGICGGSRLRDDASAVRFRGQTIDGICRMPLGQLQPTIKKWRLNSRERKIAGEIIREITGRVQFLNDVGLDYLTLGRSATTLSNGEAQRIRLAGQLGSGLCGVLYVLDEPTIGLHPRDNTKLLSALHRLRDLGNTLIVVEHDREVIANSDYVCDFGPGAGSQGGHIVAQADPEALAKKRKSVTGPYLSDQKFIPVPSNRRPGFHLNGSTPKKKTTTKKKTASAKSSRSRAPEPNAIEIRGARHNNLKSIDVRIPLETLTVITGPSGCGKSSLVNDILYNALASRLHRASLVPGAHDEIRGLEFINKVIRVDQQPIGNTPTSNPATYSGAFELIRQLFAQLPESKLRGFSGRRFSFNVPGGRCENCAGNGQICIEMHFLPDVWVTCEACQGKRYNEETLAVRYHGQSINDVLDMPCGAAVKLFANIPKIAKILQTLCDVGLDYLTLGQPAPTLSGGEAQRVKLASELARPDTGRTIYLLDEPTTGLHFEDLQKLLVVLHRLVDMGNTVVLIEHNLDIIKSADWVVDLGPGAGRDGGSVVCEGTPESIVASFGKKNARSKNAASESETAKALKPVLDSSPTYERPVYQATMPEPVVEEPMLDITEVGKGAKMPWEIDGRNWHIKDRVGRDGKEVQWDGRILEKVIDRIEATEDFGATDWNSRSVVEIAAKKKSNGWFFHAITGESWLLKMKFRCRRGTFKRNELLEKLPLRTLNEMDDIPLYGNQPRVKLVNHRSAWQEVEIRVFNLDEIDTPEFWEFVDTAIDSFLDRTKRVELKIDDHMPWTKLGQKWHFMRKGFPPGGKVQWDVEVLEVLHELLEKTAPQGQILWNNKQVVHVFVPDQKEPWVSIQTKKVDGVWLQLSGPKDRFALGQIADLGNEPTVRTIDDEKDIIRLSFSEVDQVHAPEFAEFLEQHIKEVSPSIV